MGVNPAWQTRYVALTLECSMRRMGQWEYPDWQLLDAGESPARTAGFVEHDDGGRRLYVWQGLPVTLYPDAAEGYWYNLSGEVPSLFVVCRPDAEDERLAPVLVTLDHDQAAAHLETDDTVLSAPLAGGLRTWLEAFVAEHYKPERRKKRRRQDWSEEGQSSERPRASRPRRGD